MAVYGDQGGRSCGEDLCSINSQPLADAASLHALRSGVLAETPYSFKTRFENEKGTNPEELIAAAHAGCFTMALAFGLQAGGYTPTELATEAAVTLEPEGQGFRISRSALTLRAQVPNLDQAAFARMAGDAEKNCPVSKVLNAAITLDAKLI